VAAADKAYKLGSLDCLGFDSTTLLENPTVLFHNELEGIYIKNSQNPTVLILQE
jgi:hypothetical protein